MADLYYYEEGYIDSGYHVYIANAEIYISPYFEDGYIDAGYYQDYSAIGALTCAAEIVTGVTVEASGTWTSEFTITALGYRLQQAESSQSTTFTQTIDATNLRGFDLALSMVADQSSLVGRIQQAAAAFTDAFTPSLVADAFKNHTAVIDVIASMNTEAVVDRSANVLLEHIADLNAMAAKTAVFSSNLSTTASATTTPVKIIDATASFAVTASVTADGFDVKFADSAIQARSNIFASRYLGTDRPVTVTGTFSSDYLVNSATRSSILSRLSKEPNWFFEIGGYIQPTGIWQSVDVKTIFTIPLGNKGNISCSIRYRAAQGVTFTVTALGVSRSYATGALYNDTAPINFTIGVSFIDGQSIAIYFSGTRLSTASNINPAGWSITNPVSVQFAQDFPYTLSGSTHNCYTNYAWLTYGDLTNGNSSSYSLTPRSNTLDTVFFYEFANGQETTAITHTGAAALATTADLSAQANPNTKSASASITAQSTVSVVAIKAIEAIATVSAESSTAITSTKIIQYTSAVNTTATLVDGLERIRYAESTQNALFSPSVAVQATKVGEIVLQSAFTVTTEANSFTDVPASLASQFAVTADVDGITRITAAALSTSLAVTAVIGTQEFAMISITGAFNATVNVEYFEGTALLAPMTATMTAAAVKTARITRTLASALTVTTNAFKADKDPAPVLIPHDRALFHFDETSNYIESYGGTHTITGTQWGFNASYNNESAKFGNYAVRNPVSQSQSAISTAPTGTDPVTVDFWWRPYADFKQVSTNNAYKNIFLWLGNNGFNDVAAIRLEYKNPDSGATNLFLRLNGNQVTLLPVANRGPTPGAGFDPYVSTQWHHVAVQRTSSQLQLFFNGQLVLDVAHTPVNLYNQFTWGSPGSTVFQVIDELRIYDSAEYSGNFTPSIQPYSVEYEYYIQKNGYAVLDSVSTLSGSAISVVFIDASLLAGTFAQTAQAQRTRTTASALTTTSTIYANAGKAAVATASVSSTATVTAQTARTRSADAAMSATSTITCAGTRVRYQSVDISSESTQITQAVKQTGNIIDCAAIVTQATVGERIRYADAAFSAFYSQLSVAAKNATGTVTLESAFSQSTSAEKNAVGVITLESQFTETANTADGKIVGFSSALSSEFTQETLGDRIQPAGSEMSIEFTITATTTDSKITRITADLAATVNLSADVKRFRDATTLEAGTFTITCVNDTIRFGAAGLSDSFSILASPTFIVRITAAFTAFNAIVTVGEVINLDPYLTLTIEAETRGLFILPENRIISIESETRVNII